MNASQQKAFASLVRAAAEYLRKDQAADYPLPDSVVVVIRSRRVAKLVTKPYTTKDGSLSVTPLGENRVELRANRFLRSGLWNGPDILPNTTLRSMLASLFHDLVWEHADELAAAWGASKLKVLRGGGDVLYLVWLWASRDTWWGRREAWLAFQTTNFAAPVYPRIKKIAAKATVLLLALASCAGCSGCFSVPDGEVESVDGVETVKRVMKEYGNGLGPEGPGELVGPGEERAEGWVWPPAPPAFDGREAP